MQIFPCTADTSPLAAMKADAMLDKGDLDGQRVWLRILKAIETLLVEQSETALTWPERMR